MANIESKKVFISYSWTMKDRVHQIADQLISNGIEVIIDIYDLKPGDNKYAFMERSVNDQTVDFVLIMSDRTYTEKANKANEIESGVGDETVVIAPEAYRNKGSGKFIPIVLEKDSSGFAYMPAYISSILYIDLSSDEHYNSEFEKLVRHIYGVPSERKPALGRSPAYLSESGYDFSDIKDNLRSAKQSVNQMAMAEMIERTLFSSQEIVNSVDESLESFMSALDQTQELRDLIIDYAIEMFKHEISPEDYIVKLMEGLSDLRSNYRLQSQQDLISFMLWELMISFTCIYLFVDDYKGLNKLLTRSFYVYPSCGGYPKESCDYTQFAGDAKTLRRVYESRGDSRKLSTMADVLMTRCNDRLLTKSRLITADLLLYQLYPLLFSKNDYWFPQTYVYQDRSTNLSLPWPRLESLSEYKRISPLFNSVDIEDFKKSISINPYGRMFGYQQSFDHALWINEYIDPQRVGRKK